MVVYFRSPARREGLPKTGTGITLAAAQYAQKDLYQKINTAKGDLQPEICEGQAHPDGRYEEAARDER